MTVSVGAQVISAENYVGWSEAAKCAAIAKVFDDAYKVRPRLSDRVRRHLHAARRGLISSGGFAWRFWI